MEKSPEQHSSEKLRGGADDVEFRNMDRLGTWDPRRPVVGRIAETHRVLVVVLRHWIAGRGEYGGCSEQLPSFTVHEAIIL